MSLKIFEAAISLNGSPHLGADAPTTHEHGVRVLGLGVLTFLVPPGPGIAPPPGGGFGGGLFPPILPLKVSKMKGALVSVSGPGGCLSGG